MAEKKKTAATEEVVAEPVKAEKEIGRASCRERV